MIVRSRFSAPAASRHRCTEASRANARLDALFAVLHRLNVRAGIDDRAPAPVPPPPSAPASYSGTAGGARVYEFPGRAS